MNSQNVISLVNEIERSVPVADWRIEGVQVWPLIRTRLAFAAFDESVGGGWQRGGRMKRLLRRAATVLRSLTSVAEDLARGASRRTAASAVIVTDGVTTTRIGGSAHDVVGDPLRALLTEAGISTATWYVSHACPRPRHTPGTLLQWRLDLAQLLCAPRRMARAKRIVLPGYDEFLAQVRAAGIPSEAVAFERMAPLAARVAVMAERVTSWLRAASPRVVFLNCYYSLECAAIVHACRRLGIASVDVQHGVQGALHIAYGSWARVPRDGYDLLPDHFWCWSQAEANAIDAWRAGQTDRHAPIVGGNPWVDMWRDDSVPFVAAADRALALLLPPAGGCTVLVTLQWGMTDETFLAPVMDLIAASDVAWTWILRLHPVMRSQHADIQRRLARRGLDRVWVDDSTKFALPTVLRRANVHLTYSSSAALEAASLGVPTAVAGPHAAEHFPELVRTGLVRHVDCSAAVPALADLAGLASTGRERPAALKLQSADALRRILSSQPSSRGPSD